MKRSFLPIRCFESLIWVGKPESCNSRTDSPSSFTSGIRKQPAPATSKEHQCSPVPSPPAQALPPAFHVPDNAAGTQLVMNPNPSTSPGALGKTLLPNRLFSWLPHLIDKHIQNFYLYIYIYISLCQLHQEVLKAGKRPSQSNRSAQPCLPEICINSMYY